MSIKQFLSQTGNWLQSHKFSKIMPYQPQINDEGLICTVHEPEESTMKASQENETQNSHFVVKKTGPPDKNQAIEKLQEGFSELVDQLKGINGQLSRQAGQHDELMHQMNKLPELLESFPSVVENQKQLTSQLLEQLKGMAAKNEQFVETIERIPSETARQTDTLANIDHQLAAAADTDVQMAENFNKFNETLNKLDQSTNGQTDGILQMSRTFATSDRYLKYLMSVQNKRFMWVFFTALGVCAVAILILTGIIIYLQQ